MPDRLSIASKPGKTITFIGKWLSIEDWSGIAKRLELKGIKEGTKVFDDYISENYNKPWLESALQLGDEYNNV